MPEDIEAFPSEGGAKRSARRHHANMGPEPGGDVEHLLSQVLAGVAGDHQHPRRRTAPAQPALGPGRLSPTLCASCSGVRKPAGPRVE